MVVYNSFQDLENNIGYEGIRQGGIFYIKRDSLPASFNIIKGHALTLTSNSPIGFTPIALLIIGTICVVAIVVAITPLILGFLVPQQSEVVYKDENKVIVANGDGTTTVIRKDDSAKQFGENPLGLPLQTIMYVIIILAIVIILFYYALQMKKKGK